MAREKQKLQIIPLGGLGEIGKNMTVVRYGDEILLIDAGLMFPDEPSSAAWQCLCPDYP